MQIQKILVPTDFSSHAESAATYACELARKFQAEVHLLNVVDFVVTYAVEMEFAAANHAYDVVEAEKRAADLLKKLPGDMGDGCRIVRATNIGSAAQGIVKYADEHDIDMIVLCTHGRSGLSHFLMGSVAESVVRRAPCPVLTMHPEPQPPKTEETQTDTAAV